MSKRLALLASAVLVLGLAPGVRAAPVSELKLTVLGNRADLISGGDALVELSGATRVRATLNGRNITSVFAHRLGGHPIGLVTGLSLGRNVLTVTASGNRKARLVVTNHPNGGPIFAGAQVQPWPCATGAVDAKCDRPARYQYSYKRVGSGDFAAYDPTNPPPAASIASASTDQGITVPYVVREEIGAQDRGEYRIAVLFDPAKPWAPWAPQRTWNGKAYVTGGSGCGVHHGQATSPVVLDDNALSRGYAVISTSLDHNTLNCNLVVQAEALIMLKERVTEAYGPIRFTVGSGCSGGSIYQQQVANAYPGIFDGLIVSCSFPDTWSTLIEAEDCSLLDQYWSDPSRWATAWSPAQFAAVAGHPTQSICNSWRDVYGFSEAQNPRASSHPLNTQDCNVPAAQTYDAVKNPRGVRCDLADYMASILGKRPDGRANRPWDNVGVQYGLRALLAGQITAAQFTDLNVKIGSHDIDYQPRSARVAADTPALATVYRGGLVDEANNLDLVPIIDIRGHDEVEIHHDYRSYVMRARLDRSNGGHGNQVIWTGATQAARDSNFPSQALTVMDAWLSTLKADHTARPLAQKVLRAKPAAAHDRCTNGSGNDFADQSLCPVIYPYWASPRIVSGSPFTEDAVKCQLKPMSESDYSPAQFTTAQWSALRKVFPAGVCDWSRPGVGQQPTIAWQTYADGPGGTAMQPAPVMRPVPPVSN